MAQRKSHPVLIGVCAVLFAFVWAVIDPLKATDPDSPRFNPDRFSFSDYKDRQELIVVYKKLFPIGTPKSFVDRVLVKAGGATCGPLKTFPSVWYCRQPRSRKHWDMGPHFSLIYDDNMHLLNINPNGAGEIYPDSKTRRDIEIEYLNKQGEMP